MKPIMNLDEVKLDDVEENGIYTSSRGQISDHIGARKLGYTRFHLEPRASLLQSECPGTAPQKLYPTPKFNEVPLEKPNGIAEGN